jgi:hypothetical protein
MPPRLLIFLILLAATLVHGCLLAGSGTTVLRLPSEGEKCKMTYGSGPARPCGREPLPHPRLAYDLMFKSATNPSAGSELLLAILGPGIVGGLCLPWADTQVG